MSGTFEDKIAGLAEKSRQAVENRFSEAQTSLTVIQPFIAALGYTLDNFHEVETEFDADIGDRKGEKVDFALKKGGHLAILIEAKSAREQLNDFHRNQLFRYFTVTDVKIAILTNGREAWFYADLVKDNVMDDEPFFKFNFQHNNEIDVARLKQFHKNIFDIDTIIRTAREIENSKKLEKHIKDKIISPDEDFAHFISKAINGGRLKKHEIFAFQNSIRAVFSKMIDGQNSIPIIPISEIPRQKAISNPPSNPPVQNLYQKAIDEILPMMPPHTLHDEQNFRETFETLMAGHKDRYTLIAREPRRATFLNYIKIIYNLGNVGYITSTTCVKFYIDGQPFTSIEPMEKAFKVGLNITQAEIYRYENIVTSWPNPNHRGIGYTHADVNENTPNNIHDAVFDLIKQAYQKCS